MSVFFFSSQARVKECQENLNQQKELLNACNKEIRVATKELKGFQDENKKIQLEIQELDHKKNKLQKESKDTVSQVL